MSARVFQFNKFYQPYLDYFDKNNPTARYVTYQERLRMLLDDRFAAVGILEPVYDHDSAVRYTVLNDTVLQYHWAEEHHLKSRNLDEILLAQIEEHRAEVVYTGVTNLFDGSFFRRLPGCVKKRVCHLAAPPGKEDLSVYDLRLSSHRPFVEAWQAAGLHSAWFMPSHDPASKKYSENIDRPIDIAFAGGYSPATHTARNRLLAELSKLSEKYRIELRLMCPKWKSLNIRGLRRFSIPGLPFLARDLRVVAGPPVFGRDLYELLGRSKIAFNAAIDMSGKYRSNMRIFEALGCGACMISDEGIYPPGLEPGRDFVTYKTETDALTKMQELLNVPDRWKEYGRRGSASVEKHYSKHTQWERFQMLVAEL